MSVNMWLAPGRGETPVLLVYLVFSLEATDQSDQSLTRPVVMVAVGCNYL